MKPSKIQTQVNDTALIEVVHIHPSELDLIKVIRNSLRFGEITIKVRDGLPVRMVRVQEFLALDGKDS